MIVTCLMTEAGQSCIQMRFPTRLDRPGCEAAAQDAAREARALMQRDGLPVVSVNAACTPTETDT